MKVTNKLLSIIKTFCLKIFFNRIMQIIMGLLVCLLIDLYIWEVPFVLIWEFILRCVYSVIFYFCIFYIFLFNILYKSVFFKGFFLERPRSFIKYIISVWILYIAYVLMCLFITGVGIDFILYVLEMYYVGFHTSIFTFFFFYTIIMEKNLLMFYFILQANL